MTDHAAAPKTLDEAQQIARKEFLGAGGIHGVGVKKSQNAVRIYASTTPELNEVVARITKRCAPFTVDLVIEDQPTITPSSDEPSADASSSG